MNDRATTTGPLLGIRILDLTRLLPGPLGTMMMADMGADVIKIENPESPDYVRAFPPYLKGESANYLAFNRSKRSLVLNYNTTEGQKKFFDLVKTADVVMEQFRPGFLDKIGIGYEAARAVNSRIIYVSVTGYGQTGPYAHLAGHDLNYIAHAGVLGMTGDNPAQAPAVPGVQIADIAGGSYMSVIGTLAALQARTRTGVGQHVDVSMTDGAMPLLSAVYALHAGGQDVQRGTAPLSGGIVNYGVYACQDQKYVALGTLEPKFWVKFCALVQKPDWASFILPKNTAERADFKAQIGTLFATQPQQYWAELGLTHDLLISPVYDLEDLENDPHLQARQMILTQEHPRAGSFKTIGIPIKFSGTPAAPAWPAPAMGEDTAAILASISEK